MAPGVGGRLPLARGPERDRALRRSAGEGVGGGGGGGTARARRPAARAWPTLYPVDSRRVSDDGVPASTRPVPREPRRDGRPEGPRPRRARRCASASRRGSRSRRPGGPRYRELNELIRDENLHTVCQEAACPNIGECWERGTATFMILGDTCTRRCGFCNVKTGKPTWNDPLEPARVARSVARMGLRHAVITSVDRDDLPDYGAQRVRRRHPPDPPPGAELQGRGPHAGLPGPGDAAGQGHRRAPRRLQPQRRGRPAPVPVARRGSTLGALAARAAQRQGDGRRRGRRPSPA